MKATWLALAVVLLPSVAAQETAFEDPVGDVVRFEGLQAPRGTGGPLADAVDIAAVFVHHDGGLAFHFRLKDLRATDGSALYPSAQYAVRFEVAGHEGVRQLMAVYAPREVEDGFPAWRFGYYDETEAWWEANGTVDLEADAVTLKALWPGCFGSAGEVRVLSAHAWLHDNPDAGGDQYMDAAGAPDRGATGAAGILGVGPPPCAGAAAAPAVAGHGAERATPLPMAALLLAVAIAIVVRRRA